MFLYKQPCEKLQNCILKYNCDRILSIYYLEFTLKQKV